LYRNPNSAMGAVGEDLLDVAEQWADVQAVGVAPASGVHVRLTDKGLLY